METLALARAGGVRAASHCARLEKVTTQTPTKLSELVDKFERKWSAGSSQEEEKPRIRFKCCGVCCATDRERSIPQSELVDCGSIRFESRLSSLVSAVILRAKLGPREGWKEKNF